jgi:predicted peptidase
MRLRLGLGFALGLFALLPLVSAAEDAPRMGQHSQTFDKDGTKLDYLLYLPPDYGKDEAKSWPLIMFLHGSGERGTDVNQVKRHGPPKIVEADDSPLGKRFIVVSPQCPPKDRWRPEELNHLLDDVVEHYHIDKDRIYLTGLSMGGFGTWAWAEQNPGRFAAIAPMCGGGDATQAEKLKALPIWVFHGEMDKTVPIERDQEMVDAVKTAGDKDVKFTKYPDAGHDCWTRSYANPELYEWFLKHKRGESAAAPAPKIE